MEQMEATAAPIPKLRGKPNKIWILITFVAGAAGAIGAVAAGGTGTYDVEPFHLELSAKPAITGKTELAVNPIPGLKTGHAEAPTHQSPIVARVTVLGVSDGFGATDAAAIATPVDLAHFMGDDAKAAVRSFAVKCALLALGGGMAAGAALSFVGMRFKRVIGAGLAGLLVFGIIGALMQQTYDTDQFLNAKFVLDVQKVTPPGELPSI